MKLRIGDTVYLQMYEVERLVNERLNFQAKIIDELFETLQPVTNLHQYSRYAFTHVFKSEANVAWLMEQDWIVDFTDYRGLSAADLRLIASNLQSILDREVADFNHKTMEYRDKHYKDESIRFSNSYHRLKSLGIMAKAADGEIQFLFPKEIIKYVA